MQKSPGLCLPTGSVLFLFLVDLEKRRLGTRTRHPPGFRPNNPGVVGLILSFEPHRSADDDMEKSGELSGDIQIEVAELRIYTQYHCQHPAGAWAF